VVDEAGSWPKVAGIVGAPDFILPWLDRFYEPAEVDLLLALADGPLERKDLASALALSEGDLASTISRA